MTVRHVRMSLWTVGSEATNVVMLMVVGEVSELSVRT